jgi:hypothetical protein
MSESLHLSCPSLRDPVLCFDMQGSLYKNKVYSKDEGKLALVLGAGNQIPVVCSDILYKLIMDDSVVICKMNPVNAYLGPILR